MEPPTAEAAQVVYGPAEGAVAGERLHDGDRVSVDRFKIAQVVRNFIR